MKTITNGKIALFCASDFAKGIFTGMIANYLIYFFQPSDKSGLTPVITQGYVLLGFFTLIGLVKAIGHLIDAFTDPLVANWSDKCKNKNGRRIPFMKWSAVPFGLSTFLIFCPPVKGVHWVNNLWVSVFICLYFIFYTVYMIPQTALFPELIADHKKRLFGYSMSSFFFVAGSALVYLVPLPVDLLKKAGMTANAAYQITFLVYTIIGIVLLLVSAFSIKEKDYVNSVKTLNKLWPSLKSAFKNKHFTVSTIAYLLEYTSMAFFQATIMYYITELLGLPEAQAPIILVVSIILSIALYPAIVAMCKRIGKKIPLMSALIIFIVSYLLIYFGADWNMPAMAKGIMIACIVSYPFAVLNIIPNSISSDVIQYDTVENGENREGIFSGARQFVTKMGQSIAIMIVPSVIAIGSVGESKVGIEGVKLTAIISAVFCFFSLIAYCFYKDKEVIGFITKNKTIETPPYSEITEEL